MRTLPLCLAILGLAGVLFAYWGLETVSGRKAFDEMAGMIPVGAGVVGAILLIAAAIVWWLGRGGG